MCNKIIYILLPDYAAHIEEYLSEAIATTIISLKKTHTYVSHETPFKTYTNM